MVSHPELGSDPPMGSGRESGCDNKPLAFSVMGARHIGTPTHWKGPMQIYRCGHGLFYQIGRGRTLSNNHGTEGTQLRLAFYNMQVQDPEVPRV